MTQKITRADPDFPSQESRQNASGCRLPLISYALKGLQRAWMPTKSRYSYIHRLDLADRSEDENLSVPASDTFYTLNILLGMSRLHLADRPAGIDIPRVYRDCCLELTDKKAKPYAYGMALWAGAALDINPPSELIDQVRGRLLTDAGIRTMTAQDAAMLASGVIALAPKEGIAWRAQADRLISTIKERYFHPPTRLFFNQEKGVRRSFSSFASQVYPTLALYHYGETFAADWAIRLAGASATKIMSLQGPRGEWGWFYYVPGGQVVDFYEVYSVHQHGMAPAFLHHAIAHRVPGAQASLVQGFNWLFGNNEMGVSMLCPEKYMFYRSQVRAGELNTTIFRGCRSVINAAFHRGDGVGRHRQLTLRRECRSYELGWILWSFAGRADCAELTHHAAFRV